MDVRAAPRVILCADVQHDDALFMSYHLMTSAARHSRERLMKKWPIEHNMHLCKNSNFSREIILESGLRFNRGQNHWE